MRVLFVLSVLLIFISCKELGEAIKDYQEPVIEDFVLSQTVVSPGDTVTATVTATNPEDGLLTYDWENPDGGQFIPPTEQATVKWIAPLAGDEYRIRAVVSNNETVKSTKSVTVQSLDKPIVIIKQPLNNQYFVQGENIDIHATAYHDNDLNKIWLLLDDTFIDSLDWNSSNEYQFVFTPDFSTIGQVELKVIAEAFNQPGNTSSDYITINIEGILPKTGNP